MHQDYPYFPYKKHTMLAVFIHFDDTTPANGGLAIYPGSRELFLRRKLLMKRTKLIIT
ncbi:hypothetical protein G9C98_004379 [Cotesia typhae]|uniref:Uncharacterized protein n=1 Tax=Cotesia typhae TaxID=2053667 RepID=A0A8J5QYQ3_9HYME|nr:hypothetical protein G9C98_004379 [Cotesia typhae]